MKSRIYGALIVLAVFTFIGGCTRDKSPLGSDNDIVYATSFESEAQLRGWQFTDAAGLYDDAPATGGKKSAYIAGGCLVPHAYLDLAAVDVDRRLFLECWGKNLGNGGTIILGPLDDNAFQLYIEIKNKEWSFYQSPTTLDCPAGTPLRLQLNAGGIVASAMLIDQITIRIID